MYLKKLEIIGFKSFANKTVLNFEPGITAVVGPNGCGKSNIFDSIRWVLGEQSVKSLRGTKMEDVIFNGTAKKEAINFAEVSLTFDNESRILPIDFNEVTITRRLFRSGESEYLLNRTLVRLKDISEMLMGTGIGSEAYSLIEQGKIDLVLSSRPEDRRMVFDEASGITKYKSKKRETMRKLEDVQANLLRVNDIVVEVKRQIGSVERQAAKARRYQEKFDHLKDLELKFGMIQLNELKAEIDNLNKQYEESQSGDNAISAKISEINSSLRQIQEELNSVNFKIETLSSDRLNTNNSIERDNDYVKLNKERIQEIDNRQVEIDNNILGLDERIKTQEESYAQQKRVVDSLGEARSQKETELKERIDKQEVLDKEIREANAKIREAKELSIDLNANQITCRNELSEVVARKNSNLSRKHRLEVELNKVKDEKVALDERIATVNIECSKFAESLKDLEVEYGKLKTSVEELEKHKFDLNTSTNDLEKEKVARESQLQFLEDLNMRYQDVPSKKALLALGENVPEDLELVLAKIVQKTDPSDFEQAVKKNLGEGLNSSALLCEAKFISLNTETIKERITLLDSLIDSNKQEISHMDTEMNGLKQQFPSKEEAIKESQMAFANKSSEKQALDDELKRLNDEASLLHLDVDETQEDISGLINKETELSQKLEELKKQEEENSASMLSNQELIRTNSEIREDCLISVTQLKTEIDSWSSREQAQVENLNMIEQALNDDKTTLELRKKEIFANRERREELEKEIIRLETEIADLSHKVRLVEENISQENQKKVGLNENITKAEADIAELQGQLEVMRNNSRDVQLKLQDKNYKVQGLKERVSQVYKTDLEVVIFEDLSSFNTEEAKIEIETLRKKVESFGNVNLVAIEEYDDLKQRYEFLTKQEQDLADAKESLLKAIVKINRTTRKMFIETFEKVNIEFKNYFRMLFGGGDAQLLLLDENDALESGIEIICRPPGKKLQNVLLLSGGEKSMSAIALIFAIFKVKPSPFCVLDEIDAALDESNVGRFSRMVQDFAKIAQFIIITHNKKTISSANVMYGITMEEFGVSKIVSVKFTEDQNEVEMEEQPVAA